MDELMFRRMDEVIDDLEELTWRQSDGRVKASLGDSSTELTVDQMKHLIKLARLGQAFKSMIRGANELG